MTTFPTRRRASLVEAERERDELKVAHGRALFQRDALAAALREIVSEFGNSKPSKVRMYQIASAALAKVQA